MSMVSDPNAYRSRGWTTSFDPLKKSTLDRSSSFDEVLPPTELSYREEGRMTNTEYILDTLEELDIVLPELTQVRQYMDNALQLVMQGQSAANPAKDRALLLQTLSEDADENAIDYVVAVAARQSAGDQIQLLYVDAAREAIKKGRSAMREAAPKVWEEIGKRITQVCKDAAKMDVPLGVDDQLTAHALGMRDEFLQLQQLAADREDLYQVANELIEAKLYSEVPNPSERLPRARWEDQAAAASVLGSREAPGVWLSHVAKKTKPVLLNTEERRELAKTKNLETMAPADPDKWRRDLAEEKARWEALKAEVLSGVLSQEPQRVTRDKSSGSARFVGI